MAVPAGLTRRNWRREAFSGVILASVSVPLAIAYAEQAGLPPVSGLYGLIVPGVLFALFATSGRLVAGPAAAVASLVGASLPLAAGTGADPAELAAAQAILAALTLALVWALRLGFIASALARPAVTGLVAASALSLIVRQLAAMLGIGIDGTPGFFPLVGQLLGRLGSLDAWAIILALIALAIIVIGRRITRFVPWELLVLAAGIAAFQVFGLGDEGVRLVASVHAGAPPFAWPVVPWRAWGELIPSALAIALVTVGEASFDDRTRRSSLGFALADLSAALTGGFAVGSSADRARRMRQAGSRSQLPAIVSAVLVLALVGFGAGLVGAIPRPAVAAIVLVAVAPLLRPREFGRLWRLRKLDFGLAVLVLLATLFLGPLLGVAVGVGLTLLAVLRRASRPPADLVDADGRPRAALGATDAGRTLSAPGIVIVRFAGHVGFETADAFDRAVRKAVTAGLDHGLAHLVLDCEALTGFDTTGAAVARETLDWVRVTGVTVDYSRARAALRIELEHYGLLGTSHLFESNAQAIAELG